MSDHGPLSHAPIHHEQLRVGHICAILVRNLSLRPTRDRAFQTLSSKRPGARGGIHTTSDDTDLILSLTKPNGKGKSKTGVVSGRSKSANWSELSASTSDDDVISTPTRSRVAAPLVWQGSSGVAPRLPASQSRRSIDQDLGRELSPKPILKRASTTREGTIESRYTDFLAGYSPNGPSESSISEGYESTLLSRSDSRSSSRSSHTIRRPGQRTRTTSMTSTRSVRFDNNIATGSRSSSESRRSPRLSGKLSDASRFLLFSGKSPSQIMQERLLECYVELALSSASNKSMPSDVFYKSSLSQPGLHHSWGSQGGTPMAPERDFVTIHDESPLDASSFWMRLWAKQAGNKTDAWKLVWERLVDLRELTPMPSFAQDPSRSLPHNSVLLGLAPGANSLSGRDSFQHSNAISLATSGANKDSKADPVRPMSEAESERIRRILDNVVYYAVPISAKERNSHFAQTSGVIRPFGRTAARRGSDGDGYASDPEAALTEPSKQTFVLGTQPADRRKAFLEEQRRVTELSLQETKMMPSYTLSEARALVEKQTQLRMLLHEVDDCKIVQGGMLGDPDGQIQLKLERNQLQATLQNLHLLCVEETSDLHAKQIELNTRKAELSARRRSLSASQALLDLQNQTQNELERSNHQLRTRQSALLVQMHTVHAKLLHDLETIFPIELLDASSLLFSICGLPLPNAASSMPTVELEKEERQWKDAIKQLPASSRPLFQAFDDDTISSALGLVAQLVILLSTYLSTPVHYPIATAGSRAVIQDCISLMSGPRAFPLYSKSVERYRYDYAAFLLNKNVEQLMNAHSVTVIDIRHTLPNLKNLMVTVAAAPPLTSHFTRKSHIGKSEISLRSTSGSPLPLVKGVTKSGNQDDAFVAAKSKKLSGLGLGLPTSTKLDNLGGDHTRDIGNITLPKVGKGRAETTDTLVTTRVLGSSKAPIQGGGAIDSVTRALSYFGGSRRGLNHHTLFPDDEPNIGQPKLEDLHRLTEKIAGIALHQARTVFSTAS